MDNTILLYEYMNGLPILHHIWMGHQYYKYINE
jgi:hypothetical protein